MNSLKLMLSPTPSDNHTLIDLNQMKVPNFASGTLPLEKEQRSGSDDIRHSRVHNAPRSFQALMRRALFEKVSRSMAIKAKCAECCGFERDEVANCTSISCPLWRFRPYQTKAKK